LRIANDRRGVATAPSGGPGEDVERMSASAFILAFIAVIFVVDAANRWWRQNSWRWQRRDEDGDDGPMSA
jgi:hypothetical protein